MDTNPQQFERLGNPWHGDGKISRSKRKRLGITRPGLPRRPERSSRAECDYVTDVQAKRRIENLVAAVNGNGRAVAHSEKPKLPLLNVIHSARNTELTGWQLFERRCTRAVQRAKIEARCERASRIDERQRLEARIAAAQARLEELAD